MFVSKNANFLLAEPIRDSEAFGWLGQGTRRRDTCQGQFHGYFELHGHTGVGKM